MSQSEIIVGKILLKSPIDIIYGFFRNHLGDLANLFPELYQGIHLVEGEHFSAGSVILFKYYLGHQLVSQKWSVRDVDDAKRCLIYEAIEGDMQKYYKLLRVKFEVVNGGSTSKVGGGGNFAKWTIEYEKAYENVPPPESHMDFCVKISKGVDAYLSKNN